MLIDEWISISWLAKVVDVLDAFTSLLLALLVIFFLQRSHTGFVKTQSMINRLIVWTISTGLLTSVCAILALIFVSIHRNGRDGRLIWTQVSIKPSTFIYIAFYGITSKCSYFSYTPAETTTKNMRSIRQLTPCNVSRRVRRKYPDGLILHSLVWIPGRMNIMYTTKCQKQRRVVPYFRRPSCLIVILVRAVHVQSAEDLLLYEERASSYCINPMRDRIEDSYAGCRRVP